MKHIDTRVKVAGVQFVVRGNNSLVAEKASVIYRHEQLMPISGWVKIADEVVRPDAQSSRELLQRIYGEYSQWNKLESGNTVVFTPKFIEIVEQSQP